MDDKAGLNFLRSRKCVKHSVFKKPDSMVIESLLAPGSVLYKCDEKHFSSHMVTTEWYAQVRECGVLDGDIYTVPLRVLEPAFPALIR